MLLRKQTLTPAAIEHFKIGDNPFVNDIESDADVFISGEIRYVRQTLTNTAKHGGMLAIVGESGSGKTTLRRDLHDRIAKEKLKIVLIEPSVFGMEDNDAKGKTLKVSSIAEAIITAVAPFEKMRRSTEARDKQLTQVLLDGVTAGNSYLLIIEEAHAIPTATLKHLKRISETTKGHKNLLGIVLFGQTELRERLSEQNREVREVVQRCDVVTLPALDNELEAYLKFKFDRVGLNYKDTIDASGIEGIRTKLTFNTTPRGVKDARSVSLIYPLAVANLLTASMNLAAQLGFAKVNGDVVKEA